jgi:hypothetical protein
MWVENRRSYSTFLAFHVRCILKLCMSENWIIGGTECRLENKKFIMPEQDTSVLLRNLHITIRRITIVGELFIFRVREGRGKHWEPDATAVATTAPTKHADSHQYATLPRQSKTFETFLSRLCVYGSRASYFCSAGLRIIIQLELHHTLRELQILPYPAR